MGPPNNSASSLNIGLQVTLFEDNGLELPLHAEYLYLDIFRKSYTEYYRGHESLNLTQSKPSNSWT